MVFPFLTYHSPSWLSLLPWWWRQLLPKNTGSTAFLRCPYTYKSGSRVRLGLGSNESNSSMCGVSRAGLGRFWLGSSGPSVGLGSPLACYWFVHVWEVPSQTRVSTWPQTQRMRILSLKGGTMSATMSKTFISPDSLTNFWEEYREMPVLWQVRSADYSNRTKRDEAWDLLV